MSDEESENFLSQSEELTEYSLTLALNSSLESHEVREVEQW